MVQLDSGEEYADADFSALISSLDDNELTLLSTPRPIASPLTYESPPRRRGALDAPPTYSAASQSAESDDGELATLLTNLQLEPAGVPSTPPRRQTVYQYQSPLRAGVTSDWSIAGTASQGVADGRVQILVKTKKPRRKKTAYVVFHGLQPAVCSTWAEARRLVEGIANSIHRGYGTLAEAQAAFKYAQERGWTRVCDDREPIAAIRVLPTPMHSSDLPNPLHGDESLGNQWFVVYRGITPGVYQSLLEALLNTGGVRASLYEGIPTKEEAINKYCGAIERGEVSAVLPVYIQ